jgi:hypothetical protein
MSQAQESDFQDTPQDWQRRWTVELTAAKKDFEKWHKLGDTITKRFKDERTGLTNESRVNLFSSNIQTQMAILFGNVPKASVSRRFADSNDDVARVAAEILERLLNTDIEKDSDSFCEALSNALKDRMVPGAAFVRARYVAEFEQVPETPAILDEATGMELSPAVPATERKSNENVEIDFVHWKDALWTKSRVWGEVRVIFFRNEMSRWELNKRFGAKGRLVPLNVRRNKDDDGKDVGPWGRAEVWEIWDKESRKVFWMVEGMSEVLDVKDDPLGLDGFWPCPRPMLANCLTDSTIPTPDYKLAEDLYKEIDTISSRITLLEKSVRVVGVYDKTNDAVKRVLGEATENEMIPVDNWAMFGEKGGFKGAVDWFPLDQVVNALTSLRDYRRELMDMLYQVTGMSDIMRGQSATAGTSATEQAIKAKFGSVRMQSLQDEFARFASDILRIKAEIIAKHFDAETILQRCNCQYTPDAQIAPQAVEFIKSRMTEYRIEVKPENISLTDFAALKDERLEVMQGLAGFMSAVAPVAQGMPGSMPFLLELLKWCVSGMRGASTIEGVIDQAVEAAKQAASQPQQQQMDPKLEAQKMKGQQDQMKAQSDFQKEQFKLQADLTKIQAEVQADAQREQTQATWNVREAAQKAMVSHALRPPEPPNGFKP